MVITGLTRNQFAGNGTRVRISPSPPNEVDVTNLVASTFYKKSTNMRFTKNIRQKIPNNNGNSSTKTSYSPRNLMGIEHI